MERRTAGAGLVLSLALLVHSWPWPREAAPLCTHPVEVLAKAGHTTVVRCDAIGGHREPTGPVRRLFELPIDLNCADPATLQVLSGIGPSRASAIERERSVRPFARVDELVRVPGIGPKTLARLRGALWVSPQSASGSQALPSVESGDCRSTGGTEPERGSEDHR